MEWQNSFFPVSVNENFGTKSISNTILKNTGEPLDLSQSEVVFFCIEQTQPKGSNVLRRHLYAYRNAEAFAQFADLGNYILADEYGSDHVTEVGYILSELFAEGKTVLVYSTIANFLPLAVEKAHEFLKEPYSAIEVNNTIAASSSFGEVDSEDWLTKLIQLSNTYLYHYGLLAYQSNHVDADQIEYLEKLGFETERLGVLKNNIAYAEPLVRMGNFLNFHINSLKASYTGGAHHYPNGLNGEEACAISKYAGANSHMKIVGLEADAWQQKNVGAEQFAQMIWYFMEGLYLRFEEEPLTDEQNYVKYLTNLEKTHDTLTFYKSRRTDKWWMYLPVDTAKYPQFKYLIPCSYADYETAMKGEIPHRWIQAAARLEPKY